MLDIVPTSEVSAKVGSTQNLEDVSVHIAPPSEVSTLLGSAQNLEDVNVDITPLSEVSAQVVASLRLDLLRTQRMLA